jgi:hypothetical protein
MLGKPIHPILDEPRGSADSDTPPQQRTTLVAGQRLEEFGVTRQAKSETIAQFP